MMSEREYSRIIHITLVASVRAKSISEADKRMDEAAFGKITRNKDAGDICDETGSLMEGWPPTERQGVRFSYEQSAGQPPVSSSHDDMAKWLAWCADHVTMRPFDREALAAAKEKYEPRKGGKR